MQSCWEARQSRGSPFYLLKMTGVSSCPSAEALDTGEPVEQRETEAQPCLSNYEASSVTSHHPSLQLVRP